MMNAISFVLRWTRWPAMFLQEGSIEIMDKLRCMQNTLNSRMFSLFFKGRCQLSKGRSNPIHSLQICLRTYSCIMGHTSQSELEESSSSISCGLRLLCRDHVLWQIYPWFKEFDHHFALTFSATELSENHLPYPRNFNEQGSVRRRRLLKRYGAPALFPGCFFLYSPSHR